MVDDRVAAGEHGVDVQAATEQRLLDPRQVASDLEDLDRAQEPLAGHARPVGALAADERLLDDHGLQSPESWLAYWAAFSPAAAPPMTMTSHSERSGSSEAATRAR